MTPDLSRPDERVAHERARYLEATTDLRAVEADAVAYSELGYSSSGIAKQIDSTESTVRSYLKRTIAEYGPEAVHARATGDLATEADLSPVDPGDVEEWPDHYVDAWLDAVESHPERAPDAAAPEVAL
jgi:DNA-binding CsgD family transcriptional regulator